MRALLIRSALWFLSRLDLGQIHAVGSSIGAALYRVPNGLRRVAAANLDACFPDLDAGQRDVLLRQALIEGGKTAAELSGLWRWNPSRVLELMRRVSGEDALRGALGKGRGVLLAGPHLGAWELGGLYCASRYSMTSLYRPPRIPELEDPVRRARERTGARLVPTTARGLRSVLQALDRGEVVGILPDQVPKAGTGVFAPFFGVPAYTMVLLGRLAVRSRAPVLFTFAERLPDAQGFHLHFLEATPEIYDVDPVRSAAALNLGVERCVRISPAQYQWTYKRFHRRPQGEARIYPSSRKPTRL